MLGLKSIKGRFLPAPSPRWEDRRAHSHSELRRSCPFYSVLPRLPKRDLPAAALPPPLLVLLLQSPLVTSTQDIFPSQQPSGFCSLSYKDIRVRYFQPGLWILGWSPNPPLDQSHPTATRAARRAGPGPQGRVPRGMWAVGPTHCTPLWPWWLGVRCCGFFQVWGRGLQVQLRQGVGEVGA